MTCVTAGRIGGTAAVFGVGMLSPVATGMSVGFGQTRLLPQGPYGNLCLTRLPLVAHRSYSLTCRPFAVTPSRNELIPDSE